MAPEDGLLCGARDQFWWRSREPSAGPRGARGDSRLRARPRAIPVRQARSARSASGLLRRRFRSLLLLSALRGAGVAVDTLPRRRVGPERCAK